MTGHACDLTFGATLVAADRTRFRFWAPAQRRVELMIEGREPIAMTRDADGWFAAEAACGHGTAYRYRLEDGTPVPDPAARAQAGDIDGPSLVIDPRRYVWRQTGWRGRPWRETVLYELHPGVLGGYRGVADRLPALAELGVTAVELMPIAEFPGGRNWGYDGVLLYAPEASYGSPDDLKALVDRAHELGLTIFLDVVYNHFGPDGNWLHRYAPQFFRDDLKTPWGGAIDFRRDEVRRFFWENAVYWLNEYRFDGLRFDAVHAIEPKEWLRDLAMQIRQRMEPGRHVHLVLENDDNMASLLAPELFDAQWDDDAHHVLHVLLTGERDGYYADYADDTAAKLARVMREGFVYQGQRSGHRGGPRGEPSAGLPPTAFVVFLQNHDQIGNRAMGDRLTALADPAALRAAVALLLLSPQIPMIYMGEESGTERPFQYFTSHKGELAELVREGRRREFASFPQFADPERRKAIPDPNDPRTFEASRPDDGGAGGAGWRDYYRRLLTLRRDEIAPRLDAARAIGSQAIGPAAALARWRLGDDAILTILANLGDEPAIVPPDSDLPQDAPLFASESWRGAGERLAAHTTVVWLARAR